MESFGVPPFGSQSSSLMAIGELINHHQQHLSAEGMKTDYPSGPSFRPKVPVSLYPPQQSSHNYEGGHSRSPWPYPGSSAKSHLPFDPKPETSDTECEDSKCEVDVGRELCSSSDSEALNSSSDYAKTDENNRPFPPSHHGDKGKGGGPNGKKNRQGKAVRLSINARERRRMHDLNDALDELRSVIPYAHSPSVRKLSKIATLLLAKNHILMQANAMEELRRIIAYMNQTAGIPVPSAAVALAYEATTTSSSSAVNNSLTSNSNSSSANFTRGGESSSGDHKTSRSPLSVSFGPSSQVGSSVPSSLK